MAKAKSLTVGCDTQLHAMMLPAAVQEVVFHKD